MDAISFVVNQDQSAPYTEVLCVCSSGLTHTHTRTIRTCKTVGVTLLKVPPANIQYHERKGGKGQAVGYKYQESKDDDKAVSHAHCELLAAQCALFRTGRDEKMGACTRSCSVW